MNDSTLTGALVILPPKQARVLAFVEEYYAVVKEAVPAALVARRLDVHPETVRQHYFPVLHRKGHLVTDSSPATPTNPIDPK